ncbi:MAG TPA: XTP/dITP diphosphatase [Firmicutes bacterium]|nr:XTP/dITP diphosphatase [Bacillota bacterium]
MPEGEYLVIATRNRGKVSEIQKILCIPGLKLLSVADFPGLPEVEEDGLTYTENAIKKARVVAEYSGYPSLADDSGLEVDCLDGRPGVMSARFAGVPCDDQANIRKLLALMKDIPPERRTARFRCVVAFTTPGGETITREGTCEGFITESPRGTRGFGYDPIFLVPHLGKTFGEIDEDVKNMVSHRARALGAIRFDICQALGYNIFAGNPGNNACR